MICIYCLDEKFVRLHLFEGGLFGLFIVYLLYHGTCVVPSCKKHQSYVTQLDRLIFTLSINPSVHLTGLIEGLGSDVSSSHCEGVMRAD